MLNLSKYSGVLLIILDKYSNFYIQIHLILKLNDLNS